MVVLQTGVTPIPPSLAESPSALAAAGCRPPPCPPAAACQRPASGRSALVAFLPTRRPRRAALAARARARARLRTPAARAEQAHRRRAAGGWSAAAQGHRGQGAVLHRATAHRAE
ncbi:hypothetical protein PVAP13_4NG265611 [Panicum virgatum]|uniref:Uncharacterized protein n=1 Tax=Panicum virgatum TaxID=38727 RepID=A0A8T0TI62_PANVG|nr:hypothetical protein PVAP13_4NG265611 [Panicum virgatum]